MAHVSFARWIRCGIRCGLLVSACASPCLAQPQGLPAPARIDDESVIVGGCGSEVVLATHSKANTTSVTCPDGWRCKRLAFARRVQDFYLARTGTKLAVLLEGEAEPRILDLSVADRPAATLTHNVPQQRYRLSTSSGEVSFNDQGASPSGADLPTEESAVTGALAAVMGPACADATPRWRLFHLTAEPDLYAPVLEFAEGENAFPTATSFWTGGLRDAPREAHWKSDVTADSTDGTQALRAMLDRYLDIPREEKRAQAVLYHRMPVRSYPGSWLFEYWAYYPFDTGHVVNHIHDTEHVFVEVDKLGGQVTAVLAAAHSASTPNNLYLASQPDAEPVTLPLFVFVEQGKHAMAPDINRDAIFSPGIDVNMSFESPQVWGVRDLIGQTDSHMRNYESGMTLARSHRDAWAPLRFNEYFPAQRFPDIRPAYRLAPLPDTGSGEEPDDVRSEAYAGYKLREHPDNRNPLNIYKPWAFPARQLRVGYSNMNFGPVFTLGYVTDLWHVPYLSKIRLPGRIDLELMVGWSHAEVAELGEASVPIVHPGSPEILFVTKEVETGRTLRYSGLRLQYGIQYERPTSNLFGYFASFYRRHDAFDHVSVSGTATPDSTPYPQTSQPRARAATSLGQFGVFVEVPHVRNLVLFAGPVFSDPGGFSAIYFRVAFSPWRSSRRSSFGF